MKRVVEAEKWRCSLSRETARASLARETERERERYLAVRQKEREISRPSGKRTKFIFKCTKNNCFDVMYNKPYETLVVKILKF